MYNNSPKSGVSSLINPYFLAKARMCGVSLRSVAKPLPCLRYDHGHSLRPLITQQTTFLPNAEEQKSHKPGVSSQGSMVEGVEPIVVGDGNISTWLQQHWQHVISLFAYGVVQRCVPFWILQTEQLLESLHHEPIDNGRHSLVPYQHVLLISQTGVTNMLPVSNRSTGAQLLKLSKIKISFFFI